MKKKANPSTFQQRHTVDALVKQVGLTKYEEVKRKLHIKNPVTELSQEVCAKLIRELIESRKHKPVKKTKPKQRDLKTILVDLRRKLRNNPDQKVDTIKFTMTFPPVDRELEKALDYFDIKWRS